MVWVSKSWFTYVRFSQRKQKRFSTFMELVVIKPCNNYTSSSTPIHFRYQTDECNKVPIQENDMIEEYTNRYKWYQINKALILDKKFDIGDEITQDMFISNMKWYNEVHSIVTLERKSSDQYIADRYKKEPFFNSIISLHNGLERTSAGQAQSFCGQSQTNVHSLTRHDDNNK